MNHTTSPTHRTRLLALGVVMAFGNLAITGCVHAQAPVTLGHSPTSLPPLPPPIYEPGELTSLPSPTSEQLKKGRELLDKIAYVIANIPLTDADAVLNFFGFTDLTKYQNPTHINVVPRGKAGGYRSTAEMQSTGFINISVMPIMSDPVIKTVAHLSARIATDENCILIDDVRNKFAGLTSSHHRHVTADPVQRPKPIHGVGSLNFSPIKNPTEFTASITFSFEYQICASSVNFGYSPRNLITETTK